MTNYNDGLWHGWNGGDCPVHPHSAISIVFADGITHHDILAEGVAVKHWRTGSIIAFRVLREYREPREWWVNYYSNGAMMARSSKERADKDALPGRLECIHVREVLE